MEELGYSDGYKYPHDYPGNFTPQQYMPDQLKDHRIWHAQHQPIEERQYQQMIKTWGDRFK
jgi:putative ATPase